MGWFLWRIYDSPWPHPYPDLFACGVDIHGVHDWTTEMPTFMPDYNPDQYPEKHTLAKQSSPMYQNLNGKNLCC